MTRTRRNSSGEMAPDRTASIARATSSISAWTSMTRHRPPPCREAGEEPRREIELDRARFPGQVDQVAVRLGHKPRVEPDHPRPRPHRVRPHLADDPSPRDEPVLPDHKPPQQRAVLP